MKSHSIMIAGENQHEGQAQKFPIEKPDGSCRILLEGNPFAGFLSNGRFAPCHPSKEHSAMNRAADTLGGKPLFRVSLQRSLRSLPFFQGASGDEVMGGCSLEGWQGGRVFPPPVGGGPRERVLLQECPGGPRTTPPVGLRLRDFIDNGL